MQYQIIYSARRTIAIYIERDGTVTVRAPYGVSQNRIEQFVLEKRSWLQRHLKGAAEQIHYPQDPITVEALRRQAKSELIPFVYEMANTYGFTVKSVKITSAKRRFGSCSADNGICLSLYLMLYPVEAREYVVMHELCHTIEHNHSRRFYALLDKVMPDHLDRRKLLRR